MRRLSSPAMGPDFGPFQIERGQVAVGHGDFEVRHGLLVVGLVPIVFLLADRPLGQQVLGAVVLLLQPREVCLHLLDGTLGPVESALYCRGSISKSLSSFATIVPSLK